MSGEGPSILYVITDLLVGGVPLHLHRLAIAMRNRGYRPAVVSLASPGPVGDRLRQDGVAVESCEGCCGWDIRVISRLKRILRRHDPDIVHAMLFHANLAVRLAARGGGIPPSRVVCEIQTAEIERRWHLTVDRWTRHRSRLTIGNSPSVIDHLERNGRIPADKLRLVRGGIDPARVTAARPADRSALGICDEEPMVVWTGRLDPVKGLAFLFEAFQKVADKGGARLVLVGEGGEREARQSQIERLGLQERVRFLGVRSDVPSLLKAADLFVFPSRTEGLPNALLEAMAAGCPIVATNVPGCRDLIRNEENGLLVEFGDVPGLTSAIHRLLDDRGFAESMGKRAAADVQENWHIEKTYDAYDALYDEVMMNGCSIPRFAARNQ